MPAPLNPRTIEIVKATVPALAAHGTEITRAMYRRLFEDPAVRSLFNQSHHGETGSQPNALALAVLTYAENIDNLGALTELVERIAQKHTGLQILPEHYPSVATALLAAIRDVLGDAATDEILGAWGEAYWFLADILIEREAAIYRDMRNAPGGWNGWRPFTVAERIPESEIITSFVLRPSDGGPVMRHRPGQYLTFALDIPGHEPLKRNYSISSAPSEEAYRISVKREPQGLASNWLHDQVQVGTELQVAAPAGEFFLDERLERPVVLLSGGVGLTPMVSMLEWIVANRPSQRVDFVHGTLNGGTHAMGPHVRALTASRDNIRASFFYQQPAAGDIGGRHYDHPGLIDVDWLRANTPLDAADYFICGPKPFLRLFVNGLTHAGVPADRVRYEFFGPADELLTPPPVREAA